MFGTDLSPVFEFVGGPLLVLVILALARAVSQWYKEHRQIRRDNDSISAFLFDQPSNPRTHTPFRKGWTTLVDERLTGHDAALRKEEVR